MKFSFFFPFNLADAPTNLGVNFTILLKANTFFAFRTFFSEIGFKKYFFKGKK